MKNIKEESLLEITGGGTISATIWFIAGGISVFLVGLFSGYSNPTSCNN